MPHLLVDGSGDLAALNVGDRDIHVSRGDRRRYRFIPICHGDDRCRAQVVQHVGHLDDAKSYSLGAGERRLAFDHHVNFHGDLEALGPHHLGDIAVALQEGRGGDDELKFEIWVSLNGLEDRLNSGV